MSDDAEGFAFEMPSSLVKMLEGAKAEHEKMHMAIEDRVHRIDNFLTGLKVDQLVALRFILNQENATESNQFFDGQVYALLKFVHHVNTNTGEDDLQQLMHKDSEAPAEEGAED